MSLLERDYWQSQAACHPSRRPEGVTPAEWTAIFFPKRGESTRPAREVCALCPVTAECLAAAMAPPRVHDGMWGGRSERERRRSRAGIKGGRVGYPPEKRAEALRLSDLGLTSYEVAGQLGVSPATVRNWRQEERDRASTEGLNP